MSRLVAKIDINFRADAARAIFVSEEFSDALVSKLAPQILLLRRSSILPITVFINSLGGQTQCLDFLYSLLKSQTGEPRKPRIITVAIGNAKSAAANLLALGDYAIAYPKSSIHFHGVRFGEATDVTMESASFMAAHLENTNRVTAAQLARAGTERLAFHYARLKNDFGSIKDSARVPNLSDIECFARRLRDHLSDSGDRIVDKAIERWRSLSRLSDEVFSKVSSGRNGLDFEAELLKALIDYEVARNKDANPNLGGHWVFQIVSDYLLLRDYDLGDHVKLVRTIGERFRDTFFEEGDLEKLEEIPQNKESQGEAERLVLARMQQVIKPFCFFAASIWQGLQEHENALSPIDAYWLGAVDEVYGSGLPCLRMIAESDLENLDLPFTSSPPARSPGPAASRPGS